MYLFDTDIITNIFKKKPAAALLGKLTDTPRSQQHIATITINEIVYGAQKSNRCQYHLDNLEQILLPVVNILAFDAKAAYICGGLRACLEKSGTPLAPADLEIAAIAMANELTLISGNHKHFA